jgi:hypothetical protein
MEVDFAPGAATRLAAFLPKETAMPACWLCIAVEKGDISQPSPFFELSKTSNSSAGPTSGIVVAPWQNSPPIKD